MSRLRPSRHRLIATVLTALTLACGDGPTAPRGPAGEYLLYEAEGHPVGTRYTNVAGDQLRFTGGKLTIGADSSVVLSVSYSYLSRDFMYPPGTPMPAPISYETRGRIVDAWTSTDAEGTWDVYGYAWPLTYSDGHTETVTAPIFVRGREAKYFTYRFLRP